MSRTQSADQISSSPDTPVFEPVPTPDPTDPGSPDPGSTDPGSTDPDPVPTTPPPTVPLDFEADAIDFGPEKPARAYDDFLLAALTDLNAWWADGVPARSTARPFEPLAGDVYAAYPERPDDIPGCGTPRTTYDDVQRVRRLLLRAGRLHGLRRRQRRAALHARRRLRPGDDRDRARPRIRSRDPAALRRVEPQPADRDDRAAGRLLRRRLGRSGQPRRRSGDQLHRSRRPFRA